MEERRGPDLGNPWVSGSIEGPMLSRRKFVRDYTPPQFLSNLMQLSPAGSPLYLRCGYGWER